MEHEQGLSVGRPDALRRIGHALRTPLNAMSAANQMLGLTDLSPDQRDHVATIALAADEMLAAVNDLVDLAEIELGSLELQSIPFRLPEAVREAVRQYRQKAAERGLELTVHGLSALPTDVIGDPGRLRQVIGRLVDNGIKFTQAGSVQVAVQLLAHDVDEVTVRFGVRDSGMGMTAEEVAAAFEPFHQGQRGRDALGAGLGLPIASSIVEAMGGELRVQSERGRGSVFEFSITFDRQPEPTIDLASSGSGSSWVVVLGDRPESNTVLADMLRGGGLEPSEFSSLPMASTSIALSDDPMAAPLAVVAAPTEAPFEFVERIGRDRQLSRAPLVLVTPQGERGDAAECVRLGVDAYLPQPVSPVDIVEAVRIVSGDAAGHPLITRHWLRERRRSLRVLVVDDSPTGRGVVMRSLGELGHDLDGVADGREAVEAVTSGNYDVVLMDMEMPEMDGIEATRVIRESGSKVPIIGLSAHAFSADRTACLQAGMNEHLTKPFRIEVLQLTMESLAVTAS